MLVLNIAFYQTWSLHLFTRDRPAYMHNLLNKYAVGVDNKVNDYTITFNCIHTYNVDLDDNTMDINQFYPDIFTILRILVSSIHQRVDRYLASRT